MPLVWKVVSAMVAQAGPAPAERGMLGGARKYLEQSYTNHVVATIHANRPQVNLAQLYSAVCVPAWKLGDLDTTGTCTGIHFCTELPARLAQAGWH